MNLDWTRSCWNKKTSGGGQLHSIYGPIENYPGARAKDGKEFFARFAERVDASDFDLWTGVEIASVDLKAKRIRLVTGEELQSIAIVIATGVRRRQLGIPGEQEFSGRGIIQSPSQRSRTIRRQGRGVIGGGDAAVENALLLSQVCPTVTLVNRRRTLRARANLAQQLQGAHSITVFPESRVTGYSVTTRSQPWRYFARTP